jgi:FKBP-type peptidyl-prolyl cis-trans isomerase
LKTIKRHGIGERFAKSGDTVYVHYVGTLAENGEKFDSSRDRAEEFSFALGRGQVNINANDVS